MNKKYILTLIAAILVYLGMLAAVALAQVIVAFRIQLASARLDGSYNAVVLAALALLPLAILQFYRKPRLWIYGKISASAMIIAVGYQFVGLLAAELHWVSNSEAALLVLTGLAVCFGSFVFGLIGHRIVPKFLTI